MGRFLPVVLSLVTGACVVGVNDVEKPASGGASGAGGSSTGGTGGGGTGGSGATGGAPTGGSGGVGGSGTGGVTEGGTGGGTGGAVSGGGTGGTGGTSAECGDGSILQGTEECDDSGTTSGDGCSADCKIECDANKGETLFVKTGHCYRGVTDLMGWSAAEANCVAWHGHLITINDADEHNSTEKIADSTGTPAWIGLNDQAMEGKYVWSNLDPYVYIHWEPGEPNDVSTEHAENCVVLAGTSAIGGGYSWYDEKCDPTNRSICERAVGVP